MIGRSANGHTGYSLAMAIPSHTAEDCEIMVNSSRPYGTLPGTQVCLFTSPTIQVVGTGILSPIQRHQEAELATHYSNTLRSLRRSKRRSHPDSFISSVVPGLKMTVTCHPVKPSFDNLCMASGISNLGLVTDATRLGYLIRSG